MPASRAATAICSAPLEWPSRPGLPTRIRIGPPELTGGGTARARAPAPSRRPAPRRPPPTPVGARYSPNTSRSAPAHSPTVPPALGERDGGGRQVLVGRGDRRARASSARATASVVALARATARGARSARARPPGRARGCATRRPRSRHERRRRGLGEAVHADDRGCRPTRSGAPARRCSARAGRFIASIMANGAAAVEHPLRARPRPPRRARRSCASTTCEPANRSSYSSRSVS